MPAVPCQLTSRRLTVPAHLHEMLDASALPWYVPRGAHPGWLSVTELTTASAWRSLIADYAQAYRFSQLAPAAACALQSYAGRYVGTTLTVWAASELVLQPRHNAWHALILISGNTHGVCCPDLPVQRAGSAHDVAGAIVDHLTPVVSACRSAQTITPKVAWGCIAASCAGVFGRIYRSVAAHHRPAVLAAADVVLGALDAQPGRKLLRWNIHDDPPGLTHDRTTCCLMRLADSQGACGTCPDITAVERETRQRNAVRNPLPALPITWAVSA